MDRFFFVVIFMKVVYIRWRTKEGKLFPHEIQRNKVQANNLEGTHSAFYVNEIKSPDVNFSEYQEHYYSGKQYRLKVKDTSGRKNLPSGLL